MQEVLKYVEANFGPVLILVGIASGALAWLRATIRIGQSTLSSPTTKGGRVGAASMGVAIATLGCFWVLQPTAFGRSPWESASSGQRLRHYMAYVSVEGEQGSCAAGKCILRYYVSGLTEAASGHVRYIDRIKTAGRIVSLNSKPRSTILNPEQWPANPTFLEYAIEPPNPIVDAAA